MMRGNETTHRQYVSLPPPNMTGNAPVREYLRSQSLARPFHFVKFATSSSSWGKKRDQDKKKVKDINRLEHHVQVPVLSNPLTDHNNETIEDSLHERGTAAKPQWFVMYGTAGC